jgi:hypothetical protein
MSNSIQMDLLQTFVLEKQNRKFNMKKPSMDSCYHNKQILFTIALCDFCILNIILTPYGVLGFWGFGVLVLE